MKEVTGLAGMGGQDTGGVAVGGVGVLRPWEQGRCRAGSQASWVTAVTGQWMRIPESAVREKPEAESQLLGKHTGKQCRAHLPAQSGQRGPHFLPELSLPLTYTFSLKPPLPKGPLLPKKIFS